ncbi:MAG: YqaA family protein [Candidatus Eiseniibacteriota bacterium]
MFGGLYRWTMGLAGHRHAVRSLLALCVAEASLFPVPADVLLIPIVLAQRERAWRIAILCTLASVAGGLIGYGIGYFLFEAVGRPLLEFYGYAERFADYQARYNDWGFWIVVAGGLTPIPYKVVTIASGVAGQPLVTFVLASLLSRALRYSIVTGLLWWFGPPIRAFVERRSGVATLLFLAVFIGGFLAVGYLT